MWHSGLSLPRASWVPSASRELPLPAWHGRVVTVMYSAELPGLREGLSWFGACGSWGMKRVIRPKRRHGHEQLPPDQEPTESEGEWTRRRCRGPDSLQRGDLGALGGGGGSKCSGLPSRRWRCQQLLGPWSHHNSVSTGPVNSVPLKTTLPGFVRPSRAGQTQSYSSFHSEHNCHFLKGVCLDLSIQIRFPATASRLIQLFSFPALMAYGDVCVPVPVGCCPSPPQPHTLPEARAGVYGPLACPQGLICKKLSVSVG